MYRHVARRHLELAQLWRCPVSWCTVWRGTPQDLMDHIRDGHNVPGEISLEMLFPPWTVTRQLYAESLTAQHSGILNDVLLFSEVGLPLVHHYRMHRIGRPHAAFRGQYMAQFARSPTGEHDPVDSGRAIRRCLFAGAIDGTPDGCFGCHASSAWTSPTAGTVLSSGEWLYALSHMVTDTQLSQQI